jgi:hypothetical protein
VLKLRLSRLVSSGRVREENGRYWLVRRDVLLIAHVFAVLRRIVIPRRNDADRAWQDAGAR